MDKVKQAAWSQRLRDVPPQIADPTSWPSSVRPISINEMNGLGVGKDGLIFWHGKPIQIRRVLELRKYELFLATVATVGALLQGIAVMFPFIPEMIKKALGFS